MELMIAVMAGSAVAMILIGMGLGRTQRDELAERLDRYGMRDQPVSLSEVELEESFYDRVVGPLLARFSNLIIRFAPNRSLQQTELKLARAGHPNDWNAADFWGLRGIGALVAGGLPLMLFLSSGMQTSRMIMLTLLFTMLGFFMPNTWLDRKIRARQEEIQKSLPDALDMMTVSVEAGLGFDAALQKVSEKWNNALTRGFSRVTHEMRIGRTRREALRDMAERLDVDDVTAFIAAVLQADQLGVSMAKVLRIQSEQMRIRRRQRAEEQAQKAPIKMLFPLVFLIFPAIFIVLLGPAMLILAEQFS